MTWSLRSAVQVHSEFDFAVVSLQLRYVVHAALRSLEQQTQMRFVEAKLPRGSMLLEVRTCITAVQRVTWPPLLLRPAYEPRMGVIHLHHGLPAP